ncbi:phage head closure protein [Delftia sp. SD018]|uniref:phage head closure protein n=1 Tax=unclassified Delftia TaxID=2613839 RepID=UPI001A97A028|nr:MULTISPECIES: phage head closure protein [unclassified Delftia]MBO0987551.1 phage head closure protein [Delftia sp. SD083]MBO1036158.1 phage head closure protein [Delftia sp. SD018]
MTTFRAGTLRDRIHIQRKTGGADEWGTPLLEGWENISPGRIAANVLHKSGLGTIKADAKVSIVRASIRIRRRADLDAGMRVLFDGQIYELKAVLPGPTREYIDLVCELIQGKS